MVRASIMMVMSRKIATLSLARMNSMTMRKEKMSSRMERREKKRGSWAPRPKLQRNRRMATRVLRLNMQLTWPRSAWAIRTTRRRS